MPDLDLKPALLRAGFFVSQEPSECAQRFTEAETTDIFCTIEIEARV
jgi:hypothetical protein